jgi:hypothetical protein
MMRRDKKMKECSGKHRIYLLLHVYRHTLLERFPTSAVKSYAEVDHGWVSRGDASDATVARDAQSALEECKIFFRRHLV